MTRIDERFADLRRQGRKGFVPYLTVGDPDLQTTRRLVLELDRVGADVIELGVPFSDPIADGPVIQRGTERALRQGVGLTDVLRIAGEIRKDSDVPLLLFSYTNPLMRFGFDQLASAAVAAGIDGVLASDLSIEESGAFRATMKEAGLNTVFLVAPTSSPERVRRIADASSGFLYAVSRTGVTGEQTELAPELAGFLRALKAETNLPVAVGFGISRPEHVQAVWREADAAVVGSALVREIERNLGSGRLIEAVAEYAASLLQR